MILTLHQSGNRPSRSERGSGFTLIEMLVVISVLAILMGLLMPVLIIAQRAAKKSATHAVMHKVDTALRLFKNEMGVYPYQRAYADIDAGEAWTNRLHYHLGTTIAATDLIKLQADAATAAAQYTYDCTRPGGGIRENPAVSVHAIRRTDTPPLPYWNGSSTVVGYNPNDQNIHCAQAALLNRMAQERARLAIFAGNVDVTGLRHNDVLYNGAFFSAGRDNSGTQLLTATPQSEAKPGWADDYLHGELEARYRDGEVILDAYRTPLVYIAQISEGTRHVRGNLFRKQIYVLDVRDYGLQRSGRTVLLPIDPVTSAPLLANPSALPDPSNLRHSDRRAYAAAGYEADFELWSAGPDRKFAWMRDDPRNLDNVAFTAYDKGIP